jgi:hypothetical protein
MNGQFGGMGGAGAGGMGSMGMSPGGMPGGGQNNDLMRMLMMMMMMQPGRGYNPYEKNQTPRLAGDALGKLFKMLLMSGLGSR